MRTGTTLLAIGLLGLASWWSGACSEKPLGLTQQQEVLGTALGGNARYLLHWSADGAEIFYLNRSDQVPPMDSIQAIRLADGVTRRVVSDSSIGWFSLSADGTRLYYVSTREAPPVYSLRRIGTGGQGDILIADSLALAAWTSSVAVSGTGPLVAYARAGGALFVLDDSSGDRVQVGSGVPLAFSPDGSHLLFVGTCAGTTPGLCAVPSSGGAVTALPDTFTIDRESYAQQGWGGVQSVRWDPDGVKVLAAVGGYPPAAFVTDVSNGRTTKVWEASADLIGIIDEIRMATWSPDGTMLAIATDCAIRPYHPCDSPAPRLYLVDLGSGRSTVVATSVIDIDGAEFSYDGQRIAYIVHPLGSASGAIYYQNVP